MGAGPGRAVRGGAVGGVAPGRGLLVGPGQGWAVPVLPDLDGPAGQDWFLQSMGGGATERDLGRDVTQ